MALKPYLPTAIFHNFANIDDYKIFVNREVKAGAEKTPLAKAEFQIQDPDPETAKLLSDLKTTALLVLENGKIVYEKYFLTGGENEISGSFSMAKSIVGLLTGFALEGHKIKSLDEPILHYITEWEGRDEGKITIKQLLTMTAGLNWNESYWNPFSVTTEAYYGSNLLSVSLRQRLIDQPGAHFDYESGTTQLLGLVVARAVNLNLADYASQKLWVPLHAETPALWSIDHEDGMEKAYCCFNSRARDIARIGQLVLQKGMWEGKQLISRDYIETMTSAHHIPDRENAPTDYYGYQWWIYPSEKGNVPYARGILGQYVIVMPEKNRVVVRYGMRTGKRINHQPRELIALVKWAQQ